MTLKRITDLNNVALPTVDIQVTSNVTSNGAILLIVHILELDILHFNTFMKRMLKLTCVPAKAKINHKGKGLCVQDNNERTRF